jgi:hypothetical protein
MSIKIAIPKKEYLFPLLSNFENSKKEFDFEILFANEEQIAEMLLEQKIDIGFLDPLSYGNLLLKDDFEILPTTCLSVLGFSKLCTIYFSNNLVEVSYLIANKNDAFLATIAKILISEKFNFDPEIKYLSDSLPSELKSNEAIVLTEQNNNFPISIDLSEEWEDSFETILPIGFWVIKANQIDTNYKQLTKSLFLYNDAPVLPIVEEVHTQKAHYERQGEIYYTFSESIESAIDNLLELLYQKGFLDEMTDSKIN